MRSSSLRSARWSLLLLAGCGTHDTGSSTGSSTPSVAAAPSSESTPALAYTIDALARDGELGVALRIAHPAAGPLELVQAGTAEHVRFRDVIATVGARELPVVAGAGARAGAFSVNVPEGVDEVTVRYGAMPFGEGHHGRDNIITPTNTLVSGHVFLVPRVALEAELASRGVESPSVRVRVDAPTELDVVSTYAGTREAFDPAVRGHFALQALGNGNIAIASYATEERRVGGTRLRLHVPETWPASRRREALETIGRLVEVYQRQAPCEEVPLYTVLFTPPGPERSRVAGEFWSTGQAFAPEAYPQSRRAYELVAHRLAHTINKYAICGVPPVGEREHWFIEAWPVFSEVSHLVQARITQDDQRFVELGNEYLNVLFGLSSRVTDRPMLDERDPSLSADEIEYLHYTKSGFVALMLDRRLREVTGGTKNLNDFVRVSYAAHHRDHAAFQLYEELDAYAGTPIAEDFHRAYVADSAVFYPLHEGFLRALARPAEASPVVLRVGRAELTAAQRELLVSFFRTTRLVAEADVDAELVTMLRLHDEYLRRGESFVPAEMVAAIDRLPASRRYQIAWHERRALFASDEARAAFLAAPGPPVERPSAPTPRGD